MMNEWEIISCHDHLYIYRLQLHLQYAHSLNYDDVTSALLLVMQYCMRQRYSLRRRILVLSRTCPKSAHPADDAD